MPSIFVKKLIQTTTGEPSQEQHVTGRDAGEGSVLCPTIALVPTIARTIPTVVLQLGCPNYSWDCPNCSSCSQLSLGASPRIIQTIIKVCFMTFSYLIPNVYCSGFRDPEIKYHKMNAFMHSIQCIQFDCLSGQTNIQCRTY